MVSQRWTRPEWHSTIDSTNRRLLRDPRPGRVVVADHQSAGQGRRGRSWSAPPGAALAVSVALPVPASASGIGWVPLLAGLAVARALAQSTYPLRCSLKWPNDVLAGAAGEEGKVCGLLAAVSSGSAVVGAGLNIDQGRAELPVPTATSWRLARGGSALPHTVRQEWLDAYLEHLDILLGRLDRDPERVRADYRAWCATLGGQVQISRPGGEVLQGEAEAVDDQGALVLLGSEGRTVHHAGDVVHLRAHPPR